MYFFLDVYVVIFILKMRVLEDGGFWKMIELYGKGFYEKKWYERVILFFLLWLFMIKN